MVIIMKNKYKYKIQIIVNKKKKLFIKSHIIKKLMVNNYNLKKIKLMN